MNEMKNFDLTLNNELPHVFQMTLSYSIYKYTVIYTHSSPGVCDSDNSVTGSAVTMEKQYCDDLAGDDMPITLETRYDLDGAIVQMKPCFLPLCRLAEIQGNVTETLHNNFKVAENFCIRF